MRETKKEKLTKSEQEYTKKQDSHVSIHAPVKGATFESVVLLPPLDVSIHTPVKGATLKL